MFLCLRGVCVSWLKWKLPETAPTPPLFLAFVFTEGMKLGQHSGEGGWVSALGDRGGGRTPSRSQYKWDRELLSSEDADLSAVGRTQLEFLARGQSGGRSDEPSQGQLCDDILRRSNLALPSAPAWAETPSPGHKTEPSPAFKGPRNATKGPLSSGPKSRGASFMSWFFSPRPQVGSQGKGSLHHEQDLISSCAKASDLDLFQLQRQTNKYADVKLLASVCPSGITFTPATHV